MSRRCVACALLCLAWLPVGTLFSQDGKPITEPVVWRLDNLESIGGRKPTVVGKPRVVTVGKEKWLEFDGQADGLFLDVHPLAGLKQFTVEVVFRPDANGLPEQRFFHMQEADSDDRVMFETRLTKDGKWFLDTYIKSGDGNYTQLADKFHHPLGPWYHAAIVMDGSEMRHYVNGQLEMSTKAVYKPQRPGQTSLGVRQNKVHWYKGALKTARFTPRVLEVKEFLKATGD